MDWVDFGLGEVDMGESGACRTCSERRWLGADGGVITFYTDGSGAPECAASNVERVGAGGVAMAA